MFEKETLFHEVECIKKAKRTGDWDGLTHMVLDMTKAWHKGMIDWHYMEVIIHTIAND